MLEFIIRKFVIMHDSFVPEDIISFVSVPQSAEVDTLMLTPEHKY